MSTLSGKGSSVRGYRVGFNGRRRHLRMLARLDREKRQRIAPAHVPADLTQYPERLTQEQAVEVLSHYPWPVPVPDEVRERVEASLPWAPVGLPAERLNRTWFPMSREEQEGWAGQWGYAEKVEYLRSKGIADPEHHWSLTRRYMRYR